ncbi:hypothetical protein [Kitasatospora sp. DSM 101779]|uniref:hypothetical protein n=1 Tax=Kitasatospora sp. DSM 101779 TaxID=2853165 RepID=UPI0021D896EB|nr:hypothetical protein [Kitasatospora sp. DSM 101779]MCU7826025.1 hypothetical protein [Kitasatospora sp. DSM 101779]
MTATLAALLAAGSPLVLAAPASAVTLVGIDRAVIDPKIPSRVRADVTYLCDSPSGERSLNVSVEQTDPEDSEAVSFGTTRAAPAGILCNGLPHTQTVIVQSKTYNWLADVPAIVTTTLTDLGSVPNPAYADAKRIVLTVGAAPPATTEPPTDGTAPPPTGDTTPPPADTPAPPVTEPARPFAQ